MAPVTLLTCWHPEKIEKIKGKLLLKISFRKIYFYHLRNISWRSFRFPRRVALGPRWNLPSGVDPGSFKLHKQQTSFVPPNASRLRTFRQNNDAQDGLFHSFWACLQLYHSSIWQALHFQSFSLVKRFPFWKSFNSTEIERTLMQHMSRFSSFVDLFKVPLER